MGRDLSEVLERGGITGQCEITDVIGEGDGGGDRMGHGCDTCFVQVADHSAGVSVDERLTGLDAVRDGAEDRQEFQQPFPTWSEHALHAVLMPDRDRKSTRLNSSHVAISYAVFCLKKKIE